MSIYNEESDLEVAVVHEPLSDNRDAIPNTILFQQHDAYVQLLKKYDVKLLYPNLEFKILGSLRQIKIYSRDPLFVIGNTAFQMGNMSDERSLETEAYSDIQSGICSHVSEIVELAYTIAGRAQLHGGDIRIAHDGHVLVGRSAKKEYSSQDSVYHSLRSYLERQNMELTIVPYADTGYSHIDGCCVAPLPRKNPNEPRGVLMSKTFVPESSRELLMKLFDTVTFVPESEDNLNALATNFQVINRETIVSHDNCPQTNQLLEEMGYNVHVLPWNYTKQGGAWRCMTGEIHRR